MALGAALRLLLISDQLVQVLDQIVQLRHLYVILDHITWVEEADCLDILLDSLVILFLMEQLVSVLFNDLALNLTREVRLLRDGLGFRIVGLFHQIVYLDVVLHRVKANELPIDSILLIDFSDVVYAFLARSLLNLHI